MIIKIPSEYGIFSRDVEAHLGSMFGTDPPYQNTLDAFRKIAPEWFIDKYLKNVQNSSDLQKINFC